MPPAPRQHKAKRIGVKHKRSVKHKARDRRGSARERGYSTEWDKFSKAFLASNPLCEFCVAQGRTVAARVTDHDIPHQGDPALFWDNTFSGLCVACHSGTKQRLESKYSGEELVQQIRWLKGFT